MLSCVSGAFDLAWDFCIAILLWDVGVDGWHVGGHVLLLSFIHGLSMLKLIMGEFVILIIFLAPPDIRTKSMFGYEFLLPSLLLVVEPVTIWVFPH